MTRNDLRALSRLRLTEAKVLLRNGCPDGAFYLAGYAAECALKACIAKASVRYEFPDLPRAQASWKHDLTQLVAAADLGPQLEEKRRADPEFARNWGTVREWTEKSRYEQRSKQHAARLLEALENRQHGVLRWLKHYW